jgi:hypothetical protein
MLWALPRIHYSKHQPNSREKNILGNMPYNHTKRIREVLYNIENSTFGMHTLVNGSTALTRCSAVACDYELHHLLCHYSFSFLAKFH